MNEAGHVAHDLPRKPDLTVIVPTRNRAHFLRRCLISLSKQTLDASRFEVIVVDNGSTDTTVDVARSFVGQLNLTYLFRQEVGLHVGRHAGYWAARSDILTYCDDDIEACPTWLESIFDAFMDPDVWLVGGNDLPNFEIDPPSWLKLLWERRCKYGQALGALSIIQFADGIYPINPNFVWGCNFSVRRSVLDECRGFHPDGISNELIRYRGDGESHVTRYVAATGGIALFHSGASVHHFVPASRMTSTYFRKRYFAQGVSDSYSALRAAAIRDGRRVSAFPVIKSFLARARLLIRVPFAVINKPRRDLLKVELGARRAYEKGWRYHQDCVRKDPELFQWIAQADYMSSQPSTAEELE